MLLMNKGEFQCWFCQDNQINLVSRCNAKLDCSPIPRELKMLQSIQIYTFTSQSSLSSIDNTCTCKTLSYELISQEKYSMISKNHCNSSVNTWCNFQSFARQLREFSSLSSHSLILGISPASKQNCSSPY